MPPIDPKLYQTIKLERYDVGGHTLTRAAGLVPVKRRRMNSLEATIAPEDYPRPDHDNQRLVVAFGNGVDSWAMLIELHRRGIRPDCIQWADTGSERAHTYRAFNVIQAWCQSVGFPPIVIVRRRCPKAGHRSLAEQTWHTQQLPSPAFHRNHSCSISWKLEPQRKYQQLLGWLWEDHEVATRKGTRVTEAIGYEAAEDKRSSRYTPDNTDDYQQWYPLIDYGMDRQSCLESIDAAGLPRPGKSACFFCPVSKLCELKTMAIEEPENIAFALALEERFQAGPSFRREEFEPYRGLHGKTTWAEWMTTDPTATATIGLSSGALPPVDVADPVAKTVSPQLTLF
tara:strand:+ start:13856 stop:14881 length:1026 start_codon:yes stop_codon:yes gene_type:complete